jgi:transmembrane sensor
VSEARSDTQPLRADAIEAQAAAFLEQRTGGDEADGAALDAWLAQSWAHRTAYLRLEAAWRRTDRLAALRGAETEQDAHKARRFPRAISIAAGFGVLAILGVIAGAHFTRPQDRIFSTPVGGHESVSFADGTRIELSTDTLLRVRMTTSERVVWLEHGEAYFQVRHDADHPFAVIAGNHRITDLGTKFLVRRDPGRLEVALVEGRARFDAPHSQSQSAVLTPGDVVTATASTVFITHETGKSLAGQLAWRKGMLVFDNMTLADAAAEFNRYNEQKLLIADPAVANLTIVGKFRTNDVAAFARIIRNVLGLKVAARGEDFVISR